MRTNFRCCWGVVLLCSFCGCSNSGTTQNTEQPAAKPTTQQETIEAAEPEMSAEPTTQIFRNQATLLGVLFQHSSGVEGKCLMPEIMGAGVALLDFDRDGDLDIYFVNGGPTVSVETNPKGANQLFQQNVDGTFENVTAAMGAGDEHFGMGVAVADVNNDGFPDLYLTNYGEDQLYLNDAGKRFVNVTQEAGLKNQRWSVSAAFADINRDGWLDLYVANYVDFDPSKSCPSADGLPDYCNPQVFPGTTDLMLLHSGELTEMDGLKIPMFEDVSASSGIGSAKGAGLGIAPIDANKDGWIDWYTANDMTPNFLWINQQDNTFIDEAVVSGVALDGIGNGQASMGIVIADLNGDLSEDIFLSHLTGETNTLYLELQPGVFEVASHSAGLGRSSFADTGFGTVGFDMENDGDLDLAVVNGKVTLSTEAGVRAASSTLAIYAQPNKLFEQQSKGRFVSVSDPGFCSDSFTSRGMTAGDIDADGDIDLLVNNSDASAEVWINEAASTGHWIDVRPCLPKAGGRPAVGALVTVRSGTKQWMRRLTSSGSYASALPETLHVGLGSVLQIDSIDVQWPDGSTEAFLAAEHQLAIDKRIELQQGDGKVVQEPTP